MNWIQRVFATISEFCSDMIREEKGGKFSSKKGWGHIFMSLAGCTYILDLLEAYTMNLVAFNTMVITGCALIGMKTIKEILKKDLPKSE